eukprot:CAMPEP_0197920366 /NCGR_PEP_ID=MMETSP1439-20131203/88830_1 /TAXON_ID=66791 /ORGANISM="Gonyaulax spinifera, Strain CCMP409" /LENGTH=64 /DNA_ID=CAMNT_0043542565 /DNA_START=63 /DNA_END=255 /DNA_ORIENTATION=-
MRVRAVAPQLAASTAPGPQAAASAPPIRLGALGLPAPDSELLHVCAMPEGKCQGSGHGVNSCRF